MINLIRSEWYRFSHMRTVIWFLISGTLGIAILPLKDARSMGYDSVLDVSVTGYIALFCSVTALASFLLPVFIVFLTGYYEDKGYKNGMDRYAIESGYKRSQVLVSKLVTEGVTLSISILVPVSVMLLFLRQQNGMTDAVYQEPYLFATMLPFKWLIVFLNCFHIAALVILCSRLWKSGVKGALFSFAWCFVKGYACLFVLLGSGIPYGTILVYGEPFPSIGSILEGFEADDAVAILGVTVLGMIVEGMLFYAVTVAVERNREDSPSGGAGFQKRNRRQG